MNKAYGYKAWQKNFHRHVNKGEKAIRILAPAPYKMKEERDKLDPLTGELVFDENGMPQKEQVEVSVPAFRAVSVFDVSQTDGKPIPELETQELLSSVEGYEDFVQALTNTAPVPVTFEDIPGDAKGYYQIEERRIAIQENMSESQTLKTMVHEIAHSMLHSREVNAENEIVPAKDRNTKEVEAESVAFTICQHFGIDTSDYSFGYIAGWSDGKEMKMLKSSLDTIRKTSSELITGVEGYLLTLQRDREVEQEQDITLLVRNNDLTEYDLLNVRGMEPKVLVNALSQMSDDDRLSVEAYLESRGAWVIPLADEQTEEVKEYHPDYIYNTDTFEITDRKEIAELAEETVKDTDKVQTEETEMDIENLSVMQQAEKIINDLEAERTAFTGDERNLIMNYAYKLDNMDKTRELAEYIYYQEVHGNQDVALAMIDAQAEIDTLPDSMIGLSEMREYGYTWNEMLPLIQGRALELFDQDMTVYLLHEDGSEVLAEDKEQILAHNGIFGVEKDEWKKEIAARSMQEELNEDRANLESQLLYGSTDKYGIYQLKHDPELAQFRFEGTESLMRMGILKDNYDEIKPENYELVYVGELSELQGQTQSEKLGAAFEKFNIDRPEDFKGHSLSVSDIVVLHQDGENSSHFVDSFGFTGLPDFTKALEGVKESEIGVAESEDLTEQSEEIELDEYDEIIDLGEDREQVLAQMKQSLTAEQETELAFQIADRYISIQETSNGYDYSIMGADYKEIDGGVYDNLDVTIREALTDIVEDLKSQPDHNGAKGNITEKDELIPIDYDGLMEKVEAAEQQILPESSKSSVVADFKAKTKELFHDISEMNPEEIEETVKLHVQAKIEEYDIDAEIVDVAVAGSRCRGLEQENSDLDVVVELSTGEREDDLFNAFNNVDGIQIGDIKVDINPITAQRTGTLETYLPTVEQYLEGVRQAREQEAVEQVQEQKEVTVTLTVAECGEFHSMGELHENIPTVEEAINLWKQIPPERMHGIPAIGINVHREGEESYKDDAIDLVSGKRIDLSILEYIPNIMNEPRAMEVVAELVAKLPDMEIDGALSEEMQQRVQDIRNADMSPLEKLASEIDRFTYDYDTYGYKDAVDSRENGVRSICESLTSGEVGHLTTWFVDVISESDDPEEIRKATELLEKLSDYKPLAQTSEMEEQNYNMIDNVLNNGVGEKAQKEAEKKEQDKSVVKASLKARLAEKKAEVAGKGKKIEEQESSRKEHQEI